MKYGFKDYITKKHPIRHPRRPFDIRRDLTRETKGLFVYLTLNGKIAKRTKAYPESLEFQRYTPDKSKAFVWFKTRRIFTWVPVDAIHISEQQEVA